jgi:raffinose/stachyose/melibiose transport system substrate-binding protein
MSSSEVFHPHSFERSFNRRQFVKFAGGATLSLSAFLAACGGSNSTSSGGSSASQNLSIHFLSVQNATQPWPTILSAITAEYAKKHAGTTFTVDYVPQNNLNQKVQLLAAQGALPVMYNTPPTDTMSQLIKNGEGLDLEATLQKLGVLDQITPAASTIVKKLFDGKLVSLPFELNIEGFWYNKQIFSQNGLKPPTTWDELGQIAAKLQAKGIQPFAASGIQGWPLTRLVGNYLYRKLGPTALEDVQSGKAKLTDSAYVDAAQQVANLGKQGYFGKGVATLDYTPALDLFLQGKTAMIYMGSWALADFNNPKETTIGSDNIDYFPFPNVTGGVGNADQTPMNAGQTTSINKAKYDDAFGQWLAYMVQNYGDMALQKQGAVTGFTVHNKPASLPALTTLVVDRIARITQPVLWFEALFSTKATNISQQDATPLVTAAMSPANFMAAVQQAL